MKILLLVVGAAALLVCVAVVIGYLLPVHHTATRSIRLRASTGQLWPLISDLEKSPAWRTGVKSVERQPDMDGHEVWRETNARNDAIDYETIDVQPGKKLVRRIATRGLPFGGTWTFALAQDGTDSTLTITEDGQVYNPVFRFVSRFVIGTRRRSRRTCVM